MCEKLVSAGFFLLRVYGVSSCVASQGPIGLIRNTTSIGILFDYPRPAESYVFITMDGQLTAREYAERGQVSKRAELLHRHYGLHIQRPVDETDILFGSLVHYMSDETEKSELSQALFKQRERPSQHITLGLSGVSAFHRDELNWQEQLGIEGGIFYGPVEAAIPNPRFLSVILQGGSLRRLVLQSYSTEDMLQVISLLAFNPLLQMIEVPAQGNNIFARIDSIHQGCHNRALPVEVNFLHQQQERIRVLAKVVIGGAKHSKTLEVSPRSQTHPAVGILECQLDHGPIWDDGVQVLDSASRLFPFALTSFTVDITSLSPKGLVHVCNVLQRSDLQHLHLKCVPFMASQEMSIAQVLQAIQWLTIKSLVLTDDNIDYWLKLWSSSGGLCGLTGAWIDSSTYGLSLASLSIIAHEKNKSKLSHESVLAIHHLMYSFCLIDLHLENILLEKKTEWDLVLGGIHYSSLGRMSFKGCDISDSQK